MPILATSVVMDTEDFLHPEGPQSESPKYSVPSPPLPNALEVPANHIPCLFASSPDISFCTILLSVSSAKRCDSLLKAFQDKDPQYMVVRDHTIFFFTLFRFQEGEPFIIWIFVPSAVGLYQIRTC